MPDKGDFEWADIRDAFDDSILLGNGASIAISDRFRYDSLLERAIQLGFLNDDAQALFGEFDTQDFEYVLRMLMIANRVNEIVGNQDPTTTEFYEHTREALIRVVREIHLEHSDVRPMFEPIARFLSNFRTVFSLNYDLIVYWATLWSNSNFSHVPAYFKDCMYFNEQDGYNGEMAKFWRDFRGQHPRHPDKKPVLIFYPHGNLGLVAPIFGRDRKVARDQYFLDADLLTMITSEWESGNLSPLFVSEGESEQKERAIGRSDYLGTVFDEVIPGEVGENLVMYGYGMKDNDDHITSALIGGKVERLAFGLHGNSQDTRERVLRKVRNVEITKRREIDVLFFNSTDDGAWIHPLPDQD